MRWIQTSHHHLINNKTAKLHVDIFSFISVSASCSFLKYLVTVQERDHREKREFFLCPDTDSFKTGNMDKPSADCIIQIYQLPPQALRFSQGRGERLVMNRKGPWEGYRRQGKPVVSFPPSFARTFSSRERRLGTRQQIYAADASGMTRFGLFVVGSLYRHQKCTH